MKPNMLIRILLSVLFIAISAAASLAGPGSLQSYMPVTTMSQAEGIKPGDHIAVGCPKCGRMKTMVADKGQSFLHSYTCDTCKAKFRVREDAHGNHHGAYISEDDSGRRLSLSKLD